MKKVDNRMPLLTHFLRPNRVGQVCYSIELAVDSREEDITKSGENGTEHERNHHHVDTFVFPNVLEVEAVFYKGKA